MITVVVFFFLFVRSSGVINMSRYQKILPELLLISLYLLIALNVEYKKDYTIANLKKNELHYSFYSRTYFDRHVQNWIYAKHKHTSSKKKKNSV